MIGGMIDWRPEIRRRSKVTNMHVTARIALVGLLLLPSAAFAQRAGPAAGARRDDYVKAAQARAEGLAGKRFDQIDGGHKGVISRDAYIKYYEARSARLAARRFERMDTDHNGVLEESEIAAWRAAHKRARRAGAPAN
jgi:hypothetical protein